MEKVILLMLVASIIGGYVMIYRTPINVVAGSIAVAIFVTSAQNALITYVDGPEWISQATWLGALATGFGNLAVVFFVLSRDYSRYLTPAKRWASPLARLFHYTPIDGSADRGYASNGTGLDWRDKLYRKVQLNKAEKESAKGNPRPSKSVTEKGWVHVKH